MANEYTYSEIMEMQDKAIERVRQMQERARRTMVENPIENIPLEKVEDEKPQEPSPEEVKAEPVENISPKSNPRGMGGFLSGLNLSLDKDKATVLPLLLLLMNEGADSLLLLALVYIMA